MFRLHGLESQVLNCLNCVNFISSSISNPWNNHFPPHHFSFLLIQTHWVKIQWMNLLHIWSTIIAALNSSQISAWKKSKLLSGKFFSLQVESGTPQLRTSTRRKKTQGSLKYCYSCLSEFKCSCERLMLLKKLRISLVLNIFTQASFTYHLIYSH